MNTDLNESLILQHLFEERDAQFGAISPAILQTSNFSFATVDDLATAFADEKATAVYSRGLNPTVRTLEQKLAALEGAQDCLMVGSGAAAITNTVLSEVQAGDHVICVEDPYGWAKHLMTVILPRFGVTHTFVDGTQIENFANAITPRTKVIYLESPNSWTFEMQDLAAVAKLAKAHGITTIVDNSYATALGQKPISFGIDLVIHSASKYYNGHSDVVAGVICGSKQKIKNIFQNYYMMFGNILSPLNAWLILRGLRTLDVRLERSAASAQKLVEFLAQHPTVEKIHYPFLQNHPQAELVKKQLLRPMGMFSVEFKQKDKTKIKAFCDALQYFLRAVSWGGYESLVIPNCIFVADNDPQVSLVRFYVGLEDVAVLQKDLEQALLQLE